MIACAIERHLPRPANAVLSNGQRHGNHVGGIMVHVSTLPAQHVDPAQCANPAAMRFERTVDLGHPPEQQSVRHGQRVPEVREFAGRNPKRRQRSRAFRIPAFGRHASDAPIGQVDDANRLPRCLQPGKKRRKGNFVILVREQEQRGFVRVGRNVNIWRRRSRSFASAAARESHVRRLGKPVYARSGRKTGDDGGGLPPMMRSMNQACIATWLGKARNHAGIGRTDNARRIARCRIAILET